MSEFRIAGVLKLTAPLHVAAPGDRVIDLHSLHISYGEPDADRMEGLKSPHDSGMVYLPIFPANDARGRLRRLAAAEIFNVLASRGEKLTLETYHGMTCGAVTGQPSKELSFDQATRAGKHSFSGCLAVDRM